MVLSAHPKVKGNCIYTAVILYLISVVYVKFVIDSEMIPEWLENGARPTSYDGTRIGDTCQTIPDCLQSMCKILQRSNTTAACLMAISNINMDTCQQWTLNNLPWHAHRMLIMTIPIFVLTLISGLIGYKGDKAGTWMFVLFNWTNCVMLTTIGGFTVDIPSHPWSVVSNTILVAVLFVDALRITTLLFRRNQPRSYDNVFMATDL